MYGILLESVQEYVITVMGDSVHVNLRRRRQYHRAEQDAMPALRRTMLWGQECGEEIWLTILRESGAKNTEFNTQQHYPDTLMLRLASVLARIVTKDPKSPSGSSRTSPVAKKKSSFKSRSSAKSHSSPRNSPARLPRTQSSKCPFTSTAAIKEITKEHIASYNSNEEIYKSQEEPNTPFIIEYLNEKIKSSMEFTQKISSKNSIEDTQNVSAKVSSLKEKEDGKSRDTVERNRGILVKKHSYSEQISPITENETTGARKASVSITDLKVTHNHEIIPKASAESQLLTSIPNANDDMAEEVNSKKDASFPSSALIRRESTPASSLCGKSQSEKLQAETGRRSSGFAGTSFGRRESGILSPKPGHSLNCRCAEKKAAELKEKFGTPEKVMLFFGRCFVKYFSAHGYDTFIRATGRYFCTFLQSVDNIHQRMRFTFPRMRSPTMQLARAHRLGAELVYSTTRHGFTHYLMGQLYEISEKYFKLKLNINIVRETIEGAYSITVLRLDFENSDYLVQSWGGPPSDLRRCIASDILRLRKPKTSFTWDKVVSMQSVLFELELVRWEAGAGARGDARRGSQGIRLVLLKGQMRLLEEIDAVVFLCSPIFNDLEELSNAGLFLADLNGHGLSRQMLLTGWQHCSKLELLFEKAEVRSATLEKSRGLLDTWKKRSDQLLYSMIPKPIVDHLRHDKHTLPPWQAFDCVTVMFCALKLEETGSRAGVMQTVTKMNEVYSRIDRLLDSHRVYKVHPGGPLLPELRIQVETVGSVYMVVSGAPERTRAHAAAAASAALAVSHALPALTLGVHSGPCVAGVLGRRLPRYCIVGDTVNTASRMQTTSEAGRIQISAATAALLPSGKFRLRRRGLIKVKGKGMMETFWLEGETEEDDQDEALQLFSALCCDDS